MSTCNKRQKMACIIVQVTTGNCCCQIKRNSSCKFGRKYLARPLDPYLVLACVKNHTVTTPNTRVSDYFPPSPPNSGGSLREDLSSRIMLNNKFGLGFVLSWKNMVQETELCTGILLVLRSSLKWPEFQGTGS